MKPGRRLSLPGILLSLAAAVAVAGVVTVSQTRVAITVAVPAEQVAAPVSVAVVEQLSVQVEPVEARTDTWGARPATHARGAVDILYIPDFQTARSCAESRCPPLELTLPVGTRLGPCLDIFENPCVRQFGPLVELERAVRLDMTDVVRGVPVRAVEPGAAGNVLDVALFVRDVPPIPGAEFQVSNFDGITGGVDAQEGVVVEADVERAAASVRAQVEQRARATLAELAQARGLALAAVSVQVQVEPVTALGEVTPVTVVRLRASASGAAYRKSEALAALVLPPGRFLLPGSGELDQVRVDGQQVSAQAQALMSPVDVPGLTATLTGRPTGTVRRELQARFGADRVRIDGRPVLLPWLPRSADRIEVTLQPAPEPGLAS